VIIVNFNSGEALRSSSLASLEEGLAGLEWEAIVVDNASSDGSEQAALNRDGVKLLGLRANVGFAAGVNTGMAATSASFVLMLNPDCRLEHGSVRLLVDELQKHPTCAVIGPRILDPEGTLQESARGDPNMLTGLFGRTSALSRLFPDLSIVRRNLAADVLSKSSGSSQRVDWVSGACMLARSEALAEVGGFDEGYFLYWEDADLCRRLRNTGWETRYMTGATAVHDVGQSSRKARSLANREFHRSAYRYFATHVVPQRWHPGRVIGWTILMLRSRLKSPVR
jgi:GT2 family glycosyltransferase